MHQPVMLEAVVELLQVREMGCYVDGTLGSGGHAAAVLSRLGPSGRLLGIDRDADALVRCGKRLAPFGDRFVALRGNYRDMEKLVKQVGVSEVDGVVLDFGVSSEQLDTPERGFSFRASGPLDMRMDQSARLTAAEIVNSWPESSLADIFFRYGEERGARRAARAIVLRREERSFSETLDLAAVLEKAIGRRHGTAAGRRHPATRCFQAIRMVVNDELAGIDEGLCAALNLLRVGGRMAVITFHSLEDRKVKVFFRSHAGREVSLIEGGSRWEGVLPKVRLVTKKALEATAAECLENPRSRSARLRVAERIA
ncbi:MAG: 16S rRNA (cytosine(1402)-N(4))-methyltransferase RsmH [Kiritimatiellia bacterium]